MLFRFFRKPEYGSKYDAETLRRLAEPALRLGQALLASSMELAVSPGSQQTIALQKSLLALSEALSAAELAPRGVQRVQYQAEHEMQQFGRWQRREVESLLHELGESISTLTTSLETTLESQQDVSKGLTDLSFGLESIKESEDIVMVRQVIRREVEAAKHLIERSATAEKSLRNEYVRCVKELEDRLEVAERASHTDHLTRIANRAAFDFYLRGVVSKVENGEGPYSLAFFDLDGFKPINDRYGHVAGDAALGAFAGTLSKAFEKQGFCARLGGDEFAVVANMTEDALWRRASTFIQKLAIKEFMLETPERSVKCWLGASGGVTTIAPGFSVKETMERADAALYDAKRRGKNLVVLREDSAAA